LIIKQFSLILFCIQTESSMKPTENRSPAQIKASLEHYWRTLEDWFRRRWLGLLALAILGWMVTHKDISINFSMQKGVGGFFTTASQSLFLDPLADDKVAAQNVSLTGRSHKTGNRTAAQRAKRRKQLAYVKAHHELAATERDRYHIPVSITLAQGLLESNMGESRLARENNNHFGIKCFSKSCQKGHCSNFSDDHHKDFFRIFSTVKDSYEAHSRLLQKDRYRPLFRLDTDDYSGWAHGLKKAGYATDPKYAQKLIRIIEDLDLQDLDK